VRKRGLQNPPVRNSWPYLEQRWKAILMQLHLWSRPLRQPIPHWLNVFFVHLLSEPRVDKPTPSRYRRGNKAKSQYDQNRAQVPRLQSGEGCDSWREEINSAKRLQEMADTRVYGEHLSCSSARSLLESTPRHADAAFIRKSMPCASIGRKSSYHR
jgi:hypothetical protein